MGASEAIAVEHRAPLGRRQELIDAGPACLVAAGAVLGLATAQGGYFPTSWAWASTSFLWLIGLWAVVSGSSEINRLEIAFAGLLAAFSGWIALSTIWSVAPSLSLLELQRALVATSGVAATLLLARRKHLALLLGTIVASITAVACYALATRLFPDRFETFDPITEYRLSEPVGYWNGLGIFCTVGVLIAIGFVAEAKSATARAFAAASTVIMALALYFTYSRGAWLALAAGLVATLVVSPRRLRLVVIGLAVALPATLAVGIASRSEALTNRQAELEGAVEDGRRLAVVVVGLCLAAALVGVACYAAEQRIRFPRAARIAVAATFVALALAATGAAFNEYGGPASMADRAWRAFEAPPPQGVEDLDDRLLSFSGNGRVELWRAAGDIASDHRAVGSGAGTFERLWQARPDINQRVRDAHGLYVETLAELGPIGLAAIVGALVLPLVGALRARRVPLVAGAAGAYVAFLLHAGTDWDWELSGVTLTALLVGCALLVAARERPARMVATPARIGLGAAVAVASIAAIVGGLGSSALANSFSATNRGELDDALADADRARQLMPWSGRPWIARGEAQLAAEDLAGAAASFRESIDRDARDWRAWHDLALVTKGRAQTAALARARALYPTSSEIARTAALLAEQNTPQG